MEGTQQGNCFLRVPATSFTSRTPPQLSFSYFVRLSWTLFVFTSRLYLQPQRSLVTSAFPVRHGPARLLLRGSIIFDCFFASSFELPRPKTPHRHFLLKHLLPVVFSSNGNLFLLLSFGGLLLDRGLATQPSSWLLACCFCLHFLRWAFIAQWLSL